MDMKWLQNRNSALVVDVTDAHLTVVYLTKGTNPWSVAASAEKYFSPGEQARAEIIAFLHEFIQRHQVKTDDVTLSLFVPDTASCQILSLPDLPDEEIVSAAGWQMKNLVPFDPTTALLGWHVLKTFSDEDGARKKEILFVLLKKEVVEYYLNILKFCQLHPRYITTGFVNYGWVVSAQAASSGTAGTTAVLDISDHEAVLGFYRGGQLLFARNLPISGDKMTQALTETIVSDKGTIQLTEEEARTIKNNWGIPLGEADILDGKLRASQAVALLRPLLETMAREIKFSLNYLTAKLEADSPKALFLTGVGANLKNLDRYLSQELSLPVSFLPIPVQPINHAAANEEERRSNNNKLGRAVASFWGRGQGMNFLTAEMRQRQEFLRQRAFLRMAVAVGIIFLSFDIFLLKGREVLSRRELGILRVQEGAVVVLDSLKEKVRAREDFAAQAEKGEIPLAAILTKISRALPENFELVEINFDRSTGQVILKGVERSGKGADSLTDFIEEVSRISIFKEAGLVSLLQEGPASKFEVRCVLNPDFKKE